MGDLLPLRNHAGRPPTTEVFTPTPTVVGDMTFHWNVKLSHGWTTNDQHLCPDLLRYEQIGAADRWRGRVVRAFFWAMRIWP